MVGLLAGALGTGIGQAAGAAADMAKGYIDDERKVDLQRQFADIELEKQNRLDEMKTDRKYKDDLRRKDPTGDMVKNELASSNLEAKQGAINKIDQVNTPGYLQALSKEDSAKITGEKELKAMRSGDSLASDGALGKLDPRTKSIVELYGKEIGNINTSIIKAQADNTWDPNSDNAKALLKRQSELNGKIHALLTGNSGGSGKPAPDFDPDPKPNPDGADTKPTTSRVPAVEAAPKMDLSTRRIFTAQGKDAAVASLQAKINEYETALKNYPGEGLDYKKQIKGLKDQISAVQATK